MPLQLLGWTSSRDPPSAPASGRGRVEVCGARRSQPAHLRQWALTEWVAPALAFTPDKQGGWRRPAEIAPRQPALTLRTCGVMPAEGAMATKLEAPAQEPRNVEGGGTASLAGVSRAFGAVRALEGLDLEVRAGEIVAVVGPSGCGKTTLLELVCGLQTPDAGTRPRRPRRAHAPARRAAAVAARDRQRRARAAPGRRVARRAARARAHPLFAAFGLDGFERARPARALGRHAPAGGVRCAPCSPASRSCASTSRSRSLDALTRREMQDWLAQALRQERRTVAARHPRRRGGGPPRRPRGRPVAAPGARGGRRAAGAAPALGGRRAGRARSARWRRCAA